MPLRVIFMGTPDFSVPTLRAIAEAGHEIVAVYTQPPRAAGRRGLELTPSPVQREAERLGLEVRTPASLKSEAEQQAFAALRADVAVVVAYGLLLPKAVLEATRLGCLNGHASLLPRWRGAAPIQRAIMAGDAETGMIIMKMEEGLDTGPVALVEKVAIAPDMTAGELHDRLMAEGASLMVRALAQLGINCLTFTPQATEGVTYARKIDKSETRVDWTRPSGEVHNHIRGLSPFPGAWCEVEIGGRMERLKLLRSTLSDGVGESGGILDDRLTVACGSGAVRLVEVQRAGGKPAAAQEFLRGAKIEKGTKLT
ncbi:methionyl-tRNA formyltransferase [Mesorhizobium sp. M2D.F.Ca.ET.185.01.1.1]|uniref:methionyl-tRNA formyltransferase n=1 Tax=unclassified Mesorhizobium TaxID=325217 RepID=UPI000FCBCEEA|nr:MULTISPECIES: methionyl-tRNA formyltransferase [unclassified Mesorhizobium]TGP81909.1 methionyl-tRNA formyltransferase [bacterium M00.F.Ca.ET.227.01.1.1]TGP86124.1 methionyl-tRNA formyltransferase [bacterium M00.F.Ca.ET.222.01.1.1]TGP92199.1 methionyl-tRNA formyltransferase [bacterium M00.F.Ca.ET.221.01.1.1]TGU09877.1 methionyl-tRNA formyltransferase [bacterium M00.F.Ca.ET.163.01.1.1]TGU39062.1 methionyl-tRNA formyltransferase [bacterium M00.F.Ca.ET.156.01.1.1]TGU47600.1 methionyl-tRNA for